MEIKTYQDIFGEKITLMIYLKRLETNSDVDPTIVEVDKKRYLKMLKDDQSKIVAGRSIE